MAASVTLFALLSTGCTLQQAAPTGSNGGKAVAPSPAAATGLACRQIIQCVAECADTDAACPDACSEKGSVDGKSQWRSLATCMQQNQCSDVTCTQNKCAAMLSACTGASAADAGTAVEPADGPIVATIHAAALVGEFETNIVRANELYRGKRVRVFGTVNSVSPDGDRIALVFKSSISTNGHLFCRFTQERAAGLANLHTGDEGTADGTVVGMEVGRLILENCSTP